MYVAGEWIEKVFEVQGFSNRIILVKVIVDQHVVTFLSVYAPQSGRSDKVKDLFFDHLCVVATVTEESLRSNFSSFLQYFQNVSWLQESNYIFICDM